MIRTKRNAAIGTKLAAMYEGFCVNCKQTYGVGTLITKVAHKTWVHVACTVSTPAAEPVADPEVLATKVWDEAAVKNLVAHEIANLARIANLTGNSPQTSIDDEVIREVVRGELSKATLNVDEAEVRKLIDMDVERIITETKNAMIKSGLIKTALEVKFADGRVNLVEGRQHESYNRIIRLTTARRNVLLIGPAGCGKTHLADQIAKGLGLEFAHISCSAGMSEGQLLGRLLPTGEGGKFVYVRSEFVRCYEEGGVFLFDEIDAADSNTLLVLNSALANGCMALPNRPENPKAIKHPDFVCIAAANTFGTGADRQYVGRSQLDESTLDRFRIGQIVMDYDTGFEKEAEEPYRLPNISEEFAAKAAKANGIESELCPDLELRTRLQWYRHRTQVCGVRRIISTRFLRDAYVMKVAGDTDAEIDGALMGGWSKDEKAKMTGR